MTFEEDFPSLKDEDIWDTNVEYTPFKIYSERTIQEFCLDKQKVRDNINNRIKILSEYGEEQDLLVIRELKDLKKELVGVETP